MVAAVMAKKATEQIRIDAETIRKIKMVAAHGGQTVPKLINDWLRPIAEREYQRMLKKITEEEEHE